MNEILALREVHAGYNRTRILNGVSLSINRNETLALLGPNGSGKSTVAKTVMSLTSLHEGTIMWQGNDISRSTPWRRARLGLGYVPQIDNIFRGLTVSDNLLVGTNAVRGRRARQELVDEMYELFPVLAARRSILADRLSGGERRMLSFATTLVRRPELLVLDEPTSDLAPRAIDLILDKIVEIREQYKLPILLIEQNVWRALEIADHVCLLVRGRIVVQRLAREMDVQEIGRIFLEQVNED